MPEYRRWHVPGGTYFFTVVTYGRRPILCADLGRRSTVILGRSSKKHRRPKRRRDIGLRAFKQSV